MNRTLTLTVFDITLGIPVVEMRFHIERASIPSAYVLASKKFNPSYDLTTLRMNDQGSTLLNWTEGQQITEDDITREQVLWTEHAGHNVFEFLMPEDPTHPQIYEFDDRTIVYDGAPHTIVAPTVIPAGITFSYDGGVTWINTLTEYTDVSAHSIKVNIEGVISTYTITITPATIVGVTVTPYTGVYDTAAHDMGAVAGTAIGDVITYSTDGLVYAAPIPTATNAGSYDFYVKVVRANYNDLIIHETGVVITKANIAGVTTTPYSAAYDGAAHDAVAVAGTILDDVITYSTDGIVYAAPVLQITNVGTYNPYFVKVERSSNYNDLIITVDPIAITQKAATLTADDLTLVADGNPRPTIAEATVTPTGLIAGHTVASWTGISGGGTVAGTYTYGITGPVIHDALAADVTANYNITLADGDLELT